MRNAAPAVLSFLRHMQTLPASRTGSPPGAPPDEVLSRYLAALLAGDRRGALRVIDAAVEGGHPVATLQCDVVRAAQREIGRLWECNDISIAQEHMATAISHVALSRLFELATPAERTERRVVVACVEGERHEFPARLVADFLDLGGYDVTFLGADVPTDHLMRLLRAHLPDLLALSVTMSFNAPALLRAVEQVRAEMPAMPILVGGHALAWEPALATRCGVESCDPDPASLLAAVARLIGRPSS